MKSKVYSEHTILPTLTEFNVRNRGCSILYHQRRDEEQG